jgi:hypothetical protein
MRTHTALGMSLGTMLADAFNGENNQKGVFDAQKNAADMEYKNAATRKANAEADNKEQETGFRTDDSLASSLLASIGENSADGLNDFKNTMAGSYKPLVGAPTQEQKMAGNSALPQPAYVSKFPQLQEKFAGLKQMLALGDKDLTHLSKSIQGDQRNTITKNLGAATPQEAAKIGMRTAAIEGNVNPLEMQKAALLYGLTNGDNSTNAQNAMLLSQGKTRYDNMGGTGTFDLLSGAQSLNDLGLAGVIEKKAQANQANAGATENIAQANLANTRGTHIKEGKGDGTSPFKVDSSYQSALGVPAVDDKGIPVIDPFSGRQIVNRDVKEESNFLKWASDNKYPTTDAALGDYIAKGKPRATQQAPVSRKYKINAKANKAATEEYSRRFKAAAGNPQEQQHINEYAIAKGLIQ